MQRFYFKFNRFILRLKNKNYILQIKHTKRVYTLIDENTLTMEMWMATDLDHTPIYPHLSITYVKKIDENFDTIRTQACNCPLEDYIIPKTLHGNK